jgi:antitoxin (DNA-binding transcriptional repressor) of toxin-antitoxin stability system
VVTDRGVPKALIVAIPGGDQMEIGVDEGWTAPASNIGKLSPPLRLTATRKSLDVVNEDRGE